MKAVFNTQAGRAGALPNRMFYLHSSISVAHLLPLGGGGGTLNGGLYKRLQALKYVGN